MLNIGVSQVLGDGTAEGAWCAMEGWGGLLGGGGFGWSCESDGVCNPSGGNSVFKARQGGPPEICLIKLCLVWHRWVVKGAVEMVRTKQEEVARS